MCIDARRGQARLAAVAAKRERERGKDGPLSGKGGGSNYCCQGKARYLRQTLCNAVCACVCASSRARVRPFQRVVSLPSFNMRVPRGAVHVMVARPAARIRLRARCTLVECYSSYALHHYTAVDAHSRARSTPYTSKSKTQYSFLLLQCGHPGGQQRHPEQEPM